MSPAEGKGPTALEVMPADVVRAAVHDAACRVTMPPALRSGVLAALAQPGFALHPASRCYAGALALGAYESGAGRLDAVAEMGAAAAELVTESAHLFDHVADRVAQAGDGHEVAVAIGLLACGYAIATEAAGCAGTSTAAAALRSLFLRTMESADGQMLDSGGHEITRIGAAGATEIAKAKSGSIGRLATELGANLAGCPEGLIGVLGQAGADAFTYAQLVDDIRDAYPPSDRQSDAAAGKATLPLALFHAGGVPSHLGTMRYSEFRTAFHASDAKVTSTLIAETYLNRAKASVHELGERGLATGILSEVLESMGTLSVVALATR